MDFAYTSMCNELNVEKITAWYFFLILLLVHIIYWLIDKFARKMIKKKRTLELYDLFELLPNQFLILSSIKSNHRETKNKVT